MEFGRHQIPLGSEIVVDAGSRSRAGRTDLLQTPHIPERARSD
jgi:hypothetical protein